MTEEEECNLFMKEEEERLSKDEAWLKIMDAIRRSRILTAEDYSVRITLY